jgi:hypothetical protein
MPLPQMAQDLVLGDDTGGTETFHRDALASGVSIAFHIDS